MADFTHKLIDFVEQEAHIDCCNFKKCKSSIYGYDDYEVASEANEKGWIVTKKGNVKCPKCSVSKKNKNG